MTDVGLPAPVTHRPLPTQLDLAALERELRTRVDGEVRFDAGSRGAYSTDGSNFRQVPIAVVVPRTVDAGVEAVAVCREYEAPIVSRGGGTSLAGQCTNTAVMIDWAKYCHRLISVDAETRTCVVEPGIVLDVLNAQLEEHGLRYGPEPATHPNCTLGGMIGNNSCGATAQRTGKVVDNISRLEVLLYDGTRFWCGETTDDDYAAIERRGDRRARVYRQLCALRDSYADEIRARFPDIPRRVSGYNLDSLLPEHCFDVAGLLVGSEGTLVTVLRAELELVPVVRHRTLVVLGFDSIMKAADAVPAILPHEPIALEGLDHRLVHDQQLKGLNAEALGELPAGDGYLMVQFGGDTQTAADRQAEQMLAALGDSTHDPTVAFMDDPRHEDELWQVREAGLGATAHVPNEPDTWEGWEDSAVAPERLGDYLRDLEKLYEQFGYADQSAPSLYGHFGQGCVHTRIPFRLTSAEGVATYRRFLEHAADLVVSYGGSLSGEHGDGQTRGELLPRMFGDTIMRAFGELKAVFDPHDRMNPGKTVAPAGLDEHLRLGRSWAPRIDETRLHFAYPEDGGSFVQAATRCVGVGKCRQHSHSGGAVMCPSYQATMDEEHSTRGRARLLFEMLHGHSDSPIRDGWRSEPRQGRSRSLPRLQGLQVRLPGGRRHGDLQGRVLVAPLRGQAASARPLRNGLAADAGSGRHPGPARRHRQRPFSCAPAARTGDARRRPREPRDPLVRRRDVAAVVGAPRRVRTWAARHRPAVAGHLHQHLPPAHRSGGGRPARGRRLDGRLAHGTVVLWADVDLHRTARSGEEDHAPHRRLPRRARSRRWSRRRPGAVLHGRLPFRCRRPVP